MMLWFVVGAALQKTLHSGGNGGTSTATMASAAVSAASATT